MYCLVRADEESDARWLVAAGVTFGLGLLAKLFAILPLVGWMLFLGYQVLAGS